MIRRPFLCFSFADSLGRWIEGFLLGSYLSRIGRIENPSCSACGYSSQDTSHLVLHCPATDSLRRSLFGDSLSLYDWSRPWKVARLLGLHGLPPPRKGSGKQQQQQQHGLRVKLTMRCYSASGIAKGNGRGDQLGQVSSFYIQHCRSEINK